MEHKRERAKGIQVTAAGAPSEPALPPARPARPLGIGFLAPGSRGPSVASVTRSLSPFLLGIAFSAALICPIRVLSQFKKTTAVAENSMEKVTDTWEGEGCTNLSGRWR